MANRWGKMEIVTDFISSSSKISVDGDCNHEIKRCLLLGRKAIQNLDSLLKSSDISLTTKVCKVKAMAFPTVIYRCESWTIKKTDCQRMMPSNCGAEEDSWESLGLQGDQTSQFKGNESWIFIGRTDAEAETPILWPPDVKNWLICKDSVAGKD